MYLSLKICLTTVNSRGPLRGTSELQLLSVAVQTLPVVRAARASVQWHLTSAATPFTGPASCRSYQQVNTQGRVRLLSRDTKLLLWYLSWDQASLQQLTTGICSTTRNTCDALHRTNELQQFSASRQYVICRMTLTSAAIPCTGPADCSGLQQVDTASSTSSVLWHYTFAGKLPGCSLHLQFTPVPCTASTALTQLLCIDK